MPSKTADGKRLSGAAQKALAAKREAERLARLAELQGKGDKSSEGEEEGDDDGDEREEETEVDRCLDRIQDAKELYDEARARKAYGPAAKILQLVQKDEQYLDAICRRNRTVITRRKRK